MSDYCPTDFELDQTLGTLPLTNLEIKRDSGTEEIERPGPDSYCVRLENLKCSQSRQVIQLFRPDPDPDRVKKSPVSFIKLGYRM